jgi:hypothetical protein
LESLRRLYSLEDLGLGCLNVRDWLLLVSSANFIVVGKPIRVEKTENPSAEQVLQLHTIYLEKLQELYEKYKDVYHKDRIRDLTFVQ